MPHSMVGLFSYIWSTNSGTAIETTNPNPLKKTPLFFVLLLFIHCSKESVKVEETPITHDFLVSSSLLKEYDNAVTGSFSGLLLDSPKERTIHDIEIHKIVYKTKTVDGKETQASGAVLFPRLDQSLPLVSYQHGTLTQESSAPSNVTTFGWTKVV